MSSADRNRLRLGVVVVAALGLIAGAGLFLPASSLAQETLAGTVTAPYPSVPPLPGVVQPQVPVPSGLVLPRGGVAGSEVGPVVAAGAGGGSPPSASAPQAVVVDPLPTSLSPAAAVASALPAVNEGVPVVEPVTPAVNPPEPVSVAPPEETPPKETPSKEEAVEAPPPSAEEILRRLRQPDGPPLTISQMAALNDAIKRAEYVDQIEKKMQEMNLGVASGGQTLPSPSIMPAMQNRLPVPRPDSGEGGDTLPRVLRVVGARGQYAALLSVDGAQVLAKPGDVVGQVRVASVALSGVRATTQTGGVVTLSFVAPAGADGATVSGGRR